MYYLISASVAIIGSGKYCDHISVMGPVVHLHHQLMRPAQGGQIQAFKLSCYQFDKYLVTKVSPFEWLKVSDMSWRQQG